MIKLRRKQKKYLQAITFSFFLMAFFVGSLSTAYMSSGPIILGTEMNANGTVEYLCLGNGCHDMLAMDW